MTVEDVFSIRGRGTVVTGKIEAGALSVGDEVLINRHTPVRVAGIEQFRKTLNHAEQGALVGLLLEKIERNEIAPGDLLSSEEAELPTAPDAPPAAAPVGGQPQFAQVEEQLTQFRSMEHAGLMSDPQIDESLAALAFSFESRQWRLRRDGHWESSADGRDWQHDHPPA